MRFWSYKALIIRGKIIGVDIKRGYFPPKGKDYKTYILIGLAENLAQWS